MVVVWAATHLVHYGWLFEIATAEVFQHGFQEVPFARVLATVAGDVFVLTLRNAWERISCWFSIEEQVRGREHIFHIWLIRACQLLFQNLHGIYWVALSLVLDIVGVEMSLTVDKFIHSFLVVHRRLEDWRVLAVEIIWLGLQIWQLLIVVAALFIAIFFFILILVWQRIRLLHHFIFGLLHLGSLLQKRWHVALIPFDSLLFWHGQLWSHRTHISFLNWFEQLMSFHLLLWTSLLARRHGIPSLLFLSLVQLQIFLIVFVELSLQLVSKVRWLIFKDGIRRNGHLFILGKYLDDFGIISSAAVSFSFIWWSRIVCILVCFFQFFDFASLTNSHYLRCLNFAKLLQIHIIWNHIHGLVSLIFRSFLCAHFERTWPIMDL